MSPISTDFLIVKERIELRLTPEQTLSILTIVNRWAGKTAAVYLFGSRVNDRAKGGDVDLLIETAQPLTLLDRARIKLNLETNLGLPVDIVATLRNDAGSPFQRIARAKAVRLGVAR